MGMFDSVWVNCPTCKTRIELQTKAGECILRDYDGDEVPVIIAADLHGQTAWCKECSVSWDVESDLPKTCFVQLVEHLEDEEEEE